MRYLNAKQRKIQQTLAADPLNGWKKFLPQMESILVEGEHDLLFTPSYIAGVASQIQHALSERKKSRQKGSS
jgi:thioesterase domain-containing protein